MDLTKNILTVFNTLESNGFECYLVGGCVRDMIMGRKPKDYDFTTNATPDEVEQIFSKTIPTGKDFGTITVSICEEEFEITTYRTETEYADGRHPSNVEFAKTLKEDVMRRDFTINAIAFNPKEGYIDYYNGGEDIDNKIIRCVGEPTERFLEDSLRILRAIRFSLRYNFDIETNTYKALNFFAPMLKNVSQERLQKELREIIVNINFSDRLQEFYNVLEIIFPFLEERVIKDYYIEMGPFEIVSFLREHVFDFKLAELLLFLPKDNQEIYKRNGLPKISTLSDIVLNSLKLTSKTHKFITNLLNNYSLYKEYFLEKQKDLNNTKKNLYNIQSDNYLNKNIKKSLYNIGYEQLKSLLYFVLLKSRDTEEINFLIKIIKKTDEIENDVNRCVYIKDLKIDGNDLKKLGYEGQEIGIALISTLDNVINERINNDKTQLLQLFTSQQVKG